MTIEEYAPVFALLAVQRNAIDADEAVMMAYHMAMDDLDIEPVKEAARRFSRKVDEDGKAWFPRAPEWRLEALRILDEWREQQRAILRRLPEALCKRCKDTGWKRMSNGRVKVCECQEQRRLERLGRVPLPKQLTEGKRA